MSASFPYVSLVITEDERAILVQVSADPDQNPQDMARTFIENRGDAVVMVSPPHALSVYQTVYDVRDALQGMEIDEIVDTRSY